MTHHGMASTLCCTLKGAAKVALSSSHQAKRDPVTIDHIIALHCSLDLTDAFDIVVFTLACIAFWSCCWLGELLMDLKSDPQAHVTCSTDITRGITANGMKFINFIIPCTKTNANGAKINMSNSTCDCSLTATFKYHISSNSLIPSSAPLFAFKMSDGSWAPMRWMWFLDQCNKIWAKEGLTSVKGHGFQIGGTMHLLLLSVDPWWSWHRATGLHSPF